MLQTREASFAVRQTTDPQTFPCGGFWDTFWPQKVSKENLRRFCSQKVSKKRAEGFAQLLAAKIANRFSEIKTPHRILCFYFADSVSRVLFRKPNRRHQNATTHSFAAPVIYLPRRSPAASSNLPPDIGRAILKKSVGRHGLATRGTYCRTTLLPSRCALTAPFHPYPATSRPQGGHSLLRCHNLTAIRPLTCAALCVARTFLPCRRHRRRSESAPQR